MKYKCLIAFIAITALISCDKLSELTSFNINTNANIQVNSSTLVNTPIEISTPSIVTNSNEEFKNNHTAANLIKSVTIEDLKLTITSPPGKTFSFMKSIHIYISTDDNPEVELAFQDNIPRDSATITLVTTKESLDKFLKASSYKLRTRLETRETLTETTDIQVNMKFKVTAGIL